MMGVFNFGLPSPQYIIDEVCREAREIAEEIAEEILLNNDEETIKKALENSSVGELELSPGYDVNTRINEEVDALLTYTSDNILVAYAFAGKYELPLTDIPDSIDDYAAAYAYEVWSNLIYEELYEVLKKKLDLE